MQLFLSSVGFLVLFLVILVGIKWLYENVQLKKNSEPSDIISQEEIDAELNKKD